MYLRDFLDFIKHGSIDLIEVNGGHGEEGGKRRRARTTAGGGPTDLLYGSRGLHAAYRHPRSLGPHEPLPIGPRVIIDDTVRELIVEAQEERRHLERRMGTNMEDIVTFCEGACRKRCHLRVSAEESEQEEASCSSGSKTQRYRKCGSPRPPKEDGERAMEMTPSPVHRMFGASSDSEGYHPCYPSNGTDVEHGIPGSSAHTAPGPSLNHNVDYEPLSRRSTTTRAPRYTDFEMTNSGPRMDGGDHE